MLVHPTIAAKTGTLANALAHYLNRDRDLNPGCELIRPGFVHRLDRATSGLLVVAKSQQALSVLSRHFRKRIVQKRYLALAHGCVLEDEGVITGPIGRDPNRRPQWWIAENGKPAETRYRVLQRLTKGSLVELEPVTGRTNQLRIHCAYIGHPIIGDEFYGPASGSSPTPGRLFLHASRLAFNHPRTGQPLVFASELPAELCAFLANEDV
jgi:23S rRNA pseudouridine1911/1915/1917 synthase